MKKKRIAIVTDSSVEGILSLAPAVAALKSKNADAEIALVGNESAIEAASLLPGVNFFAASLESAEADSYFDFASQPHSRGEESVAWRSYLEASLIATEGNPYHRVDLSRKVVGADLIDVNFELLNPEAPTEGLPESLESGANGLRVAVCASSLDFAELQAVLTGVTGLSIPHEVYLLGTVKDKKKSTEILSHWDGNLAIHDLCGHLSLAQTAYVLRGCDICICGPGSSALISSGYGTFTICADQNPARGPIHYPYGHGHLVIQRAAQEDHAPSIQAILREIVNHAVSANTGSVPSLEQWQAFADDRLDQFLGKIRMFATQRIEALISEDSKLTELYLRPLLYLGAECADVMQTFYRLLWEHSLNARSFTSHDLEILHQDTVASLSELLKPLEQLYQLGNFGRTYCQFVKDALTAGDMNRTQTESDKVQEVEELIFTTGQNFPALSPLTAIHQRAQVHVPDLDAVNMSDEISDIFSDLQSRVLVILDLAKSLFHTTFVKESTLVEPSAEEADTNG